MSGTPEVTLKRKDFVSDQTIRWCPGCGDYSVLKAVQAAMPQIGIKREDIVFISGIGCSSRFPYYMETYGFHSIHGRAPAFALGTKLANPDLSVWQITGDGDALAIGGNHFIHAFRRNIDINMLLFNNEIYGLTKGQYSPTSSPGLKTKSSPQGSLDAAFNPGELAIGAGAKFFARVPDKDSKYMEAIFIETASFKGAALVEILQNCNIFNDKVHDAVTTKDAAPEAQIRLEHGKKMLFGAERNKGLVQDGFKLKVVVIGEDGVTEDDILTHDAKDPDPTMHQMLIRMRYPEFPVAMGIVRQIETSSYDEMMVNQINIEKENAKFSSMDEMLQAGETWTIN